MAYDAAKTAARLARAKQAHDTVVAEIHRAQAAALTARARAEIRLAEEYDAAQERGEAVGRGGDRKSDDFKSNGFRFDRSDLGLSDPDLAAARRLRDAEAEDPGVIDRTVDDLIERGEEPTRAALRREVASRPAPAPKPKTIDPKALWLWGRLKDFEREGLLDADPAHLVAEIGPQLMKDVDRLLPLVIAFLKSVEDAR